MTVLRSFLIFCLLMLLWQLGVNVAHLPAYILPTPLSIAHCWWANIGLLWTHTQTTLLETGIGLLAGIVLGAFAATLLHLYRSLRLWILPVLLVSQAIPTFSFAPLLVLWFGYGITSKIITTIIMIFFPVTCSLLDGLQRMPLVWREQASVMGASRWRQLWQLELPNALPQFASGIRLAAVSAPMGAVIGEWVGASKGLGYLMLNASARLQIDLLFAALATLVVLTFVLYFLIDRILKRCVFWQV